jgi:hypothetical protein
MSEAVAMIQFGDDEDTGKVLKELVKRERHHAASTFYLQVLLNRAISPVFTRKQDFSHTLKRYMLLKEASKKEKNRSREKGYQLPLKKISH